MHLKRGTRRLKIRNQLCKTTKKIWLTFWDTVENLLNNMTILLYLIAHIVGDGFFQTRLYFKPFPFNHLLPVSCPLTSLPRDVITPAHLYHWHDLFVLKSFMKALMFIHHFHTTLCDTYHVCGWYDRLTYTLPVFRSPAKTKQRAFPPITSLLNWQGYVTMTDTITLLTFSLFLLLQNGKKP